MGESKNPPRCRKTTTTGTRAREARRLNKGVECNRRLLARGDNDNIWLRRSSAGGKTDQLKATPLHEEPLLQSKAIGDPGTNRPFPGRPLCYAHGGYAGGWTGRGMIVPQRHIGTALANGRAHIVNINPCRYRSMRNSRMLPPVEEGRRSRMMCMLGSGLRWGVPLGLKGVAIGS